MQCKFDLSYVIAVTLHYIISQCAARYCILSSVLYCWIAYYVIACDVLVCPVMVCDGVFCYSMA